MIQFKTISKSNTLEEIKANIRELLRYEKVVVSDEDAEKWFAESGYDGAVIHQDLYSQEVAVYNEEEGGEESYYVKVTAHYIDPGSVDYIYSFSIN